MDRTSRRPPLSVIIISKNEESLIRRTIESVIRSAPDLSKTEILLVDSGSTDRTTREAAEYPIRIIQVGNDELASPSAGRYLGTLHSTGELIQFLDGDAVLDAGWLPAAVRFLTDHKEIACVRGIARQAEYGNPLAEMKAKASATYAGTPEGEMNEGLALGPAFLIRREALERAGHFNPYFVAEEEQEFNARLLGSGARSWYLAIPMSIHLGYWDYRPGDLYRRMMKNKRGYGQVLRLRFMHSEKAMEKAGVVYIVSRGGVAIAMEASAIAVLLATGSPTFLAAVGVIGSIVFTSKAIRTKSVRSSLRFLRDLHVEWPFILRGFLWRPRPSSDFPSKVFVLKDG